MGRFDAPDPAYEKTKNTKWFEAAPPGMRSPDHLWEKYWQRFNMYSIPISDEEEYFKIALEVAEESESKEDFERKFEEKNKERFQTLDFVLDRSYCSIQGTLAARESQHPAHAANPRAKNLNCLEHLVRLLNYYVNEDVSQRKAEKESETIVVEKQDYTKENSRQERGHMSIEDETEKLIGETSPTPSVDLEYEEYLDGKRLDEDEWGSQPPHDIDWAYKLDQEYKARQMRQGGSSTFAKAEFESLKLLSDDAASHTLNSDDDIPSIQQIPSLVSNDSQGPTEGNESLATQDELRRRSSISSKSKKRARFDDDEDISTHEPKRRRLENTLMHTETSPISPTTCTSSIQSANGSASRKRSRSDEDEEDNGFKRQKIESLPHPPSPAPSACSMEDDSTSHLAQGSSEGVLEEKAPESNNGRHKRRKQKPTPPTSRANSSRNILNTRSSRRAKSSTLWELDSSGKPRLA
ncbi:hypothetical protein MKX08_001394 [Trichoderma sp. CBMAI-0020]|nr:hypothetical protein MKX08_001394 [Trichoderma sp. CBMAI-0020]